MPDADEVLRRHAAPPWFDDAKLGIFVHWGLYSIPGWAPAGAEPGVHLGAEAFARGENAYAEWYANSLRVDGSPTAQHHAETYGDAPYEAFREPFESMLETWDPTPWAELFAAAGARYVVLTTKHHDGYLLWPSEHPNPHVAGWQSRRDIVGDLGDAVRSRGLRYGLYYSGGLDWTFERGPIVSVASIFTTIPRTPAYVAYATAHVRELVERYRPSVLWNDIAWPSGEGLSELLVSYLESVPDGTINDRFGVLGEGAPPAVDQRHRSDFRTPEYRSFDDAKAYKWEMCRGIGSSFGWNRAEGEAHHVAPDELIRGFVDVVAKGGNLLLNVGPDDAGRIPSMQAARLRALGAWLDVCGEAIHGTRPWVRTSALTADGTEVRFTQADGALYALLLATPPAGSTVTIPDVPALGDVAVLGHGAVDATWHRAGVDVVWPAGVGDAPAPALRIGARRGR